MARRLSAIAKWIEENHGKDGYRARVGPVTFNTDRKVPGRRLRIPGKGRQGNKLVVTKNGEEIFSHNSAETYRCNEEVERWLEEEFDLK